MTESLTPEPPPADRNSMALADSTIADAGSATDLHQWVLALARVPRLLVACDYDGTVAPIVDDPMKAHPRRDTVVAMRALADLPQTQVAVISGRSLRDLAILSRLPHEIRLVGSHGSEFDVDFAAGLSAEQSRLRDQLIADVEQIAAGCSGAFIEVKPIGLSFHLRRLDSDEARTVAEAVISGPASRPGVWVRQGNQVIEMSVIETDKGRALESIRGQVAASAVLYFGDDVTDEDAFATLSGPDVGVKVGEGDTAALLRVSSSDDVARVLALLAAERTTWITGSGAVPIEAHSLLSDLRTAAIVAPDARITWLCLPRIDSSAVFAELLGGPIAGYFSVSPATGARPVDQRYGNSDMLLTSIWPRMQVVDYLDTSQGRTGHRAGRSDLVRVLSGTDKAIIEFAPRLDFGRVATRMEVRDLGVEVVSSADLLVLRSPGVDWVLVDDGVHHTARAEVDLAEGDVVLELRCGTASLGVDGLTEIERRSETEAYWGQVVDSLDLPTIVPDLVRRSALILKSLVHGPTGAIVAAATMSLPEHLGGVRNWDYRYCWIRDGAMTARALVELGRTEEAMGFLDWVVEVVAERGGPERMAPLYMVSGRHLPPEADIGELAGYAGSRPVRVGNAADSQIQLDVFGPLADLVHHLVRSGAPVGPEHLTLVEGLVKTVDERWHEPDHGIWEIRTAPRHHVYSRVMCWLTIVRAVQIVERLRGEAPEEWTELADRIRSDVLDHGWREDLGAFTCAYGREDIDASVLVVGLTGMLPPDDRRVTSTVSAVESVLREGPTVRRYVGEDGLPGREGGFHLMTSWLIDAYDLVGRRGDALQLFEDLCALTGPTGMLSEEYDPAHDRALGNVPQAYSHVGLIMNALRLDGRL